MTLLVIGSGLAAYLLIKELRDSGYPEKIIVITNDSGDFYSKPQISNAFALGKTAEQLITMPADDFSAKYDFELHKFTKVDKLIPDEKIAIAAGKTYKYDKCVLAVGSNVKQADWHEHVYHVNNLTDYKLLRKSLLNTKKIAIIGAGLVGCELASDLSKSFNVTLLHDHDTPISKLLPSECGYYLKNRLIESGVSWSNFSEVVVSKSADMIQVNDQEYDLVIAALGIEPNTELALNANIKVNNGIEVNGFCQTSANDVYALGDCANVCGANLAYIAPIRQCVNVLSKQLQGIKTNPIKYPNMPIIIKTPMCKTIVQQPSEQGSWQFEQSQSSMVARHINSGKLNGFVLMDEGLSLRATFLREMI